MRLKKGIVAQKLGKTYVIFDNNTSTLHEINETGFFIIEKLEKGLKVPKVVDEIVKKFDIKEGEAEKDLETFVQDLAKKDLIVKETK